jgi:hypothetical protein
MRSYLRSWDWKGRSSRPPTAHTSNVLTELSHVYGGFVDLLFTFWNNEKTSLEKTIDVQFLVVVCKSVYNCILGRPTLASLGVVPST